MTKFEITDEDIAKYKETKDKAATWWDKHKDKVYTGAIVYLICNNQSTKAQFRHLTKKALPKCFEKCDEQFVRLAKAIDDNTNDISLLKTFLTKVEK